SESHIRWTDERGPVKGTPGVSVRPPFWAGAGGPTVVPLLGRWLAALLSRTGAGPATWPANSSSGRCTRRSAHPVRRFGHQDRWRTPSPASRERRAFGATRRGG